MVTASSVNQDTSNSLIERDAQAWLPSRIKPITAIAAASGVRLTDTDGRSFIDFFGSGCHHFGYAHPRLMDALKSQIDTLTFTPYGYVNEPAVQLAERLAALWPGDNGRVQLMPGGAEAVDTALLIARAATGHSKSISFYDSYHGSTVAALSIGGRPFDRPARLGPLLPGCLHVPPYYPTGDRVADAAERSLFAIDSTFRHEGDIAAVIAEPIRLTPHFPPDWYWKRVRQLCDDNDALLIFDEIPTGLGATGNLFASESVGVKPDITILGKSLGGSALPLAAVICSGKLSGLETLELGHFTHDRNPILARAGLATLDIIEEEDLVAKARTLGERALADLEELTNHYPFVREVRCVGLLLCIEFNHAGFADTNPAKLFRQLALENGLILGVSHANAARLTPPLVTSDEEWKEALTIVGAVLSAMAAQLKA